MAQINLIKTNRLDAVTTVTDKVGVFVDESGILCGIDESGTVSELGGGVTFASNAEVLARTEAAKAISPATIDGGVKRYKALISQAITPKNSVFSSITQGLNYRIESNTTGDFINIGASNNNVGTQFIATGDTPTSWGDGVLWETPEITATVLENSTGVTILGEYLDIGSYYLKSSLPLFIENKTFVLITRHYAGYTLGVLWTDNETIEISQIDENGNSINEFSGYILIEVYP